MVTMSSSDPGTIVGLVILCLIGVGAFVGNLLVFFSVYRDKKLRTKGGVFICCLASADFLVSLYNIPLTVASTFNASLRSHKTCEIMGFFEMLLLVVSVQSLTAISLNRYFFIIKWHRYHEYFRRRNVVLFLIGIWVLSAVMCLPPLIGWSEYGYKVNKGHCFVMWKADPYYTYFMALACFCGPIVSMCFCYYRIVRYTRKTRRDVQMMSSPEPHRRNRVWNSELSSSSTVNIAAQVKPLKSDLPCKGENGRFKKYVPDSYIARTNSEASSATEATLTDSEAPAPVVLARKDRKRARVADEQRLTRMFIVVVIAFFASWFPFVITMFMEFYTTVVIPPFLDKLALLLGYANSMYNPIIYGFMNGRYRRVYAALLADAKDMVCHCRRRPTSRPCR